MYAFLFVDQSVPAQPTDLKWLYEPIRIGSLSLASRFNLAPLAGYTNLPFRLSVREVGGLGLATTDLVNARAILQNSQKTIELIATHPEDRPWAVQIYGSNPPEMAEAAKWLQDYGASVIDINMGCPVHKVTKGGGGSAMMCDTTGSTLELVRSVVDAVSLPVTVKMRLGWDADNLTAPSFAKAFEKLGVAAITIHGRTREQGFGGQVNHDGIRAVVEAVEKIPVFGNGDVRSIADADRMFRDTGCAGIAIGRGALANPWFFRQLDNWVRSGDPGPRGTWQERLQFMITHVRRLIEWRGENRGCVEFRKIATWYTKALRTSRSIQQALVRLSDWATFETLIEEIRQQGPPANWQEWDANESTIAVPSGPIAHW